MDAQLSAKFQLKSHEIAQKWNDEKGKRFNDLTSRGMGRSGMVWGIGIDCSIEYMRETVTECVEIARQHQELRKRSYAPAEIQEIEKSISALLDGIVSASIQAMKSAMASQGLNDPNMEGTGSNRLNGFRTECIPLLKTKLGDLQYYAPPNDKEIVIQIINHISIDGLLEKLITEISNSPTAPAKEKKQLVSKIASIRKSPLIQEFGKAVIGAAVNTAFKAVTGI